MDLKDVYRISLAGNGGYWWAVVKTMTCTVTQIAEYFLNGRELLPTQAGLGFLK